MVYGVSWYGSCRDIEAETEKDKATKKHHVHFFVVEGCRRIIIMIIGMMTTRVIPLMAYALLAVVVKVDVQYGRMMRVMVVMVMMMQLM